MSSETWAIGNALCGTLAVSLLTLESVRIGELLRSYKKIEDKQKNACDLRFWPVLDLKDTRWAWVEDWDGAYAFFDSSMSPSDFEFKQGDYSFRMKYSTEESGFDDYRVWKARCTGWAYWLDDGCEVQLSDDPILSDSDGNPHVRFRIDPANL